MHTQIGCVHNGAIDCHLMWVHHWLILQLLSNISGATTRDFNPCLEEDGTSGYHKGDIDDSVDGVKENGPEIVRRGHIIGDARDGRKPRGILQRLFGR